MPSPGPRYCIIGAGAAGLAALREMNDLGRDVDCFEKSDRVGGHWNTDYESLHLITSRDVSGFPGYPMPADYPVYPSRQQVLDYLNGFADEFGLREQIHFGTAVERVEPQGPRGRDGWIVHTSGRAPQHYDGVLVANGHLWDPRIPQEAGDFAGPTIHSGDYEGRHQIEGDRVLVVGSGNSGCDLAVDAAQARLTTAISIRTGHTFQPKAIFGKPRAELTWLAKLPGVLQERITRTLIDIVVGRPSAYRGLPEPPTRNLNEQPPVVNNLLLYWIQHGRIDVVPGISRVDGRTVHFVDGTSREFDTILWATGFNVRLPFLDDDLLQWRDRVPLRVGAMTVPVGLERLYFVGMSAPRGPQMPPYSQETRMIDKMLRLDETQGSGWVHEAFRHEEPESRIDIVRADWNKQMERTDAMLDRRLRAVAGRVPTSRPHDDARVVDLAS